MKLTSSVTSLVAVNMIPLFGVLFLGWDLSAIVFLYWFENVVIGFYNILKIRRSEAEIKRGINVSTSGGLKEYKSSTALAFFFAIHYGIFTTVHGAFLFNSIIKDFVFTETLFYAIFCLFVSHGLSYFVNFIGKQEYKQKSPDSLMFAPYKRVIVMHITVIIGAGLATHTSSNSLGILFALISLKTLADLVSHLIEHKGILRSKTRVIHLPDNVSQKILAIPGFKEYMKEVYEKSVRSGKWEETKKSLEPDTVKYIEEYYKDK